MPFDENIEYLLQHLNAGYAFCKTITDENNKIIDFTFEKANNNLSQLFSDTTQITGKKASDIFNNDDLKYCINIAASTKGKRSTEHTHHFKNTDRYFKVITSSEKENYFTAIWHEITEYEKTKIALEQSYNKIKILADYTYDWEYWLDTNKNYKYISPSCYRISGYTADEFHNNSTLFFNCIDTQYQSIWLNHEKETNQQICCSQPVKLLFHTKLGNAIWIEHICRPVYNESNKFMGYRGTNKDITEQVNQKYNTLNAIINAEELERKRIAQDLHDGIAPILSTLKRYFEAFDKPTSNDRKKLAKKYIDEGINEAIKQIATISNNLSPHILNDFGLQQAIESYIEKESQIQPITFNFLYNLKEKLPENIEISLYRITIELFTNSINHSKCNTIFLSLSETNNMLLLTYRDNGIGFNQEEAKNKKDGMGLFNLSNRINSLHGKLTFNNLAKGIEYNITIPIYREQPPHTAKTVS